MRAAFRLQLNFSFQAQRNVSTSARCVPRPHALDGQFTKTENWGQAFDSSILYHAKDDHISEIKRLKLDDGVKQEADKKTENRRIEGLTPVPVPDPSPMAHHERVPVPDPSPMAHHERKTMQKSGCQSGIHSLAKPLSILIR
jgi:hypothetical protein